MKRRRRRKCWRCGELFNPDPRNRYHQKYCCEPACRQASKAASQARWLAKSHNRDYFREPAHVARVRAWRAAHPGYWRKKPSALKAHHLRQHSESTEKTVTLNESALQEAMSHAA